LAIGSSDIGGAQKVFLSLAQGLQRRGRPAVAVLPDGPLVEILKPFVKTVYVANLASVTSLPQIARILWREPGAVVNAHLTKCGLLFAIVNLLFRRRLFCTLHNAVTHEALSTTQLRIYPVLYWVLQQLSEGIIVTSEQNKQHVVAAAGLDPRKVRVIHAGLDVEGFAAGLQPRARGDRFVIGSVGRLSAEKGHVFLVRALRHMKHIDCVCLIVGDGPLRHELERVAIQEGVADRVRFLGFQEDVAGMMSQMDVVVMPSLDEAFGIAVLEAFALKKLVIASDVGGLPELVRHGETGFLVPARDSVALAAAINYAFTHRSECERMGRNGYELAANTFTTAVMAEKTLEYYEAEQAR